VATKDVVKIYEIEEAGDLVPLDEFVVSESLFQCKDHI
jgi:hypothetical protein